MAEVRDKNGNITGHICYRKDIYNMDYLDEFNLNENDFKLLPLRTMLKLVFKKIFNIK
jgi:hypothetical protein